MLWGKKKIEILNKQIEDLLALNLTLKTRVKELEDAIDKEYGVKVRNEVTEVKVDFDKTELAVLLAAICKLMTERLNTDDLKYYLDLRIKLENTIDQMKD